MNGPLRRVGVVVLVLFGLLFTNLSYQQWYKADRYRTDPRNPRVLLDEYSRPRGTITLANGEVVAQSKETADRYKYQRAYPFGEEYSQVVGYKPVNPLLVTPTGIERLQDDFLSGTADSQAGDRLLGMFTGKRAQGGNVLLTLSKAAQDAAYQELKSNKNGAAKGAVVAIDPKTGALRAEISIPSFDPGQLASHSEKTSKDAFKTLNTDQSQPLANGRPPRSWPPARS
jgi:peptidoglycan glycosyltransferase